MSVMSDHIENRGEELTEDVEFFLGSNLTWGVVPSSREDGADHHCGIWRDGRRICDCQGFFYHDESRCSHLRALALSVPIDEIRESLMDSLRQPIEEPDMSVRMNIDTAKTSIDAINEAMAPKGEGTNSEHAGLQVGEAVAFVARPKTGKTLLTYQLGFEVLNSMGEGNALFFDTEGTKTLYEHWARRMAKRFDMDIALVEVNPRVNEGMTQVLQFEYDDYFEDEPDHTFYIMDVRDLEKILCIHGRPASISTDDGKMKLEPKDEGFEGDVIDTPIGGFVSNNDIQYMAYDSVTNPLEVFTNRQQDRPTRAKATSWWMLRMQELAEQYSMVVTFITHLSKNPTNPYATPDMIGGKNLKHQAKFWVYMRGAKGENQRTIEMMRHPSRPTKEKSWTLEINTAKGFIDP